MPYDVCVFNRRSVSVDRALENTGVERVHDCRSSYEFFFFFVSRRLLSPVLHRVRQRQRVFPKVMKNSSRRRSRRIA